MFVMTRPRATMISILLSVIVFAVEHVVGCDFGTFGERCDRNCSLSCAIYPRMNVRICGKDTGRCLAGCVPGCHGDHCNLTCSRNCIDNICNQKDGCCTKGCAEKYQGDFCDKEIVPDNGCPPGHFGDACDHVCPPQCAVGSGPSVGICERDTGKCHDGCQSGWHGDHCNLTSVDNISRVNHTSNQGNRDQVSILINGEMSATHILIAVSFILNVCLVVIVLLIYLQRRKAGWRLRNLCRNQDHSEYPGPDKERKILLNGLNNGVKKVTEEDRLDIYAINRDPTHQAVNGSIRVDLHKARGADECYETDDEGHLRGHHHARVIQL